MKVLLVNTFDTGGAASACIRLHNNLMDSDISSKLLLKSKTKKELNQTYVPSVRGGNNDLLRRVMNKINVFLKNLHLYSNSDENFIKDRHEDLEWFSFPYSDYDITESVLYQEADLINLHWVAGFLDYKSFFKKNSKPLVWTLHDMNPFTGGEHYSEKYLGMDNKGYPIHRVLSSIEKKQFNKNIKLKIHALSKCNDLHIVTLCNWMTQKVRNSEVFKNLPIHLIPNGIDSNVFKPKGFNSSRELLNIPRNKKVILFVADSIDNSRKGFAYLKNAFEQLESENLILCAIGNKNSTLDLIENLVVLGTINDENKMSMAYSAADVFVIPSIMDNLPNTVLESLMCGTPVIGFPVGGIVDMIQDEENGFIADDISVNSLVKSITKFLDTPDQFDRLKIRENAIKKYDQKVQSGAYINLFENILSKNERN